jgi:hypothetical protein
VLQAQLDLLVQTLLFQDRLDLRVLLVLKEILETQDRLVPLVLRVMLGQLVLLELRVQNLLFQDRLVQQVLLVLTLK